MKVLGLIPARGGSKGVPRKNIKLLGGRPLLQYTAESALAARRLTKVVLSTEDKEIAAVARACGLQVPFMRPVSLASDDTPTLLVVQHALRWFDDLGEHYDAVCILQPTSPFRPTGMIDACIEMFENRNADSVFTVLPVPAEYNPHWVFFRNNDESLRLSTGEMNPIARRQLLPPAFYREGSVSVTATKVVLEQNSLFGRRVYGFLANPSESVNIDTLADWAAAERVIVSTRT